MNFSLFFETAVAAFFIYTPGLRDVIGFRPIRYEPDQLSTATSS